MDTSENAGTVPADLQRLARCAPTKRRRSLGAERPDTRNTSRGIHRAMRRFGTPLPPAYRFQCPLWDRLRSERTIGEVAILLPHELLDFLVAEGKEEEWSHCTQPGLLRSRADWSARTNVSINEGTPLLSCGLWGDCAPFSHREFLYMLVLTVISGQHRRYLWLCGLTKGSVCQCGCYGRHTLDALFSVIGWSFRILIIGKFPRAGHTGEVFRLGSARKEWAHRGRKLRVRAHLANFFGDWSWYKQALGLTGWRSEGPGKRICWACHASASVAGEYPAWDFRVQARWRRSLLTMADFRHMAREEQFFYSQLWLVPGFDISCVRVDFMHCICLGILQYALGNTLWELVEECDGTFVRSTEACAMILSMMESMARSMGQRVPIYQLTITMVRKSATAAPKPKLKAAEGRRTLPLVRRLLAVCFRENGA